MSKTGISVNQGKVSTEAKIGTTTPTLINNTGITTPLIDTPIIKQTGAPQVPVTSEQRAVLFNTSTESYEIGDQPANAISSDNVLIAGREETTLTEYILATDTLVYIKAIGVNTIVDFGSFEGADVDEITVDIITSSGGGGGGTTGNTTTASTPAADVVITDSADVVILTVFGGTAGFTSNNTTSTLNGQDLVDPVINQPDILSAQGNQQAGVDGGKAGVFNDASGSGRSFSGTEGGSGISVFFELDLNELIPGDKVIKVLIGSPGIGAITDNANGASGNPGSVSISVSKKVLVL